MNIENKLTIFNDPNNGQDKGKGKPDVGNWWQGAVIYQIYPRSFQDTNGDGVGDLPGILQRLDHIADLGADAIWISPFFKSPMHDFGYDVSDFCDVDPIFGTLEDFDAVVEKAHRLGLKIVIDQVYSHTSNQHPWFEESRQDRTNAKADWYVWADAKPDGSPPNNWQSVFAGPAWTWDARRRQYYLHNFLSEQPDLNLRNEEVQEAILKTARFWLDRGVDGFRLDAANFYMHDLKLRDNPPAIQHSGRRTYDFQQHLYNRSQPAVFPFVAKIRKLLDDYGARFSVAEIGDRNSNDEVVEYCDGPDRFHTAYSFVFIENHDLNAEFFRHALEDWQGRANGAWASWTFSNHDAIRAPSRWGRPDDPRFAQLLNAMLMCLRGSIFLYQGEELGLPQAEVSFDRLQDPEAIANWPETLGRDGSRTPIPWEANAAFAGFSTLEPWLPMDPRHNGLAVDAQMSDPHSTLNRTKQFIALRKQHPVLQTGALTFIDADEPIIAFKREDGNEHLLCVFNLSDKDVSWSPEDAKNWAPLSHGIIGYWPDSSDFKTLPPFSGYVAQRIA